MNEWLFDFGLTKEHHFTLNFNVSSNVRKIPCPDLGNAKETSVFMWHGQLCKYMNRHGISDTSSKLSSNKIQLSQNAATQITFFFSL